MLLDVQMHARQGFKHRLAAQSFRFLLLHPHVQHLAPSIAPRASGGGWWKPCGWYWRTIRLVGWLCGECCQEAGLENGPLVLWPLSERAGSD